MLREFQIDSNPLVYTGGVAPVTFPKKPTSRSVLVGYTVKGVQLYAWQNLIGSLKVDGREHIAGEAFPLALISNQPMPTEDNSAGTPSDKLEVTKALDESGGTASGTGAVVPAGASYSEATSNNNLATIAATLLAIKNNVATLAACGCTSHAPQYFPGSGLTLSNGQRVGAIPVNPRQKHTMSLTDSTGGSAELVAITAHYVELPEGCETNRSTEAQWERLKRGIGVVTFHGLNKSAFTTAVNQALEYTPVTHGAKMARQLEIRGSLTEDATNRPKESDMALVSAEIKTNSEGSPTNGTVHARALIGTAAAPVKGIAVVDLLADEGATVKVQSPAPTDGLARTLRLCVITEGREATDKQLRLAAAPN